jgi:hypothetical protein
MAKKRRIGGRTPRGIEITEYSSCFGNYRAINRDGDRTACKRWVKAGDPMCKECYHLATQELDRILFEVKE